MKSILELNWKEIEELPKEKTFLFMTIAPMEEHGTHLPIGVDIQLGEFWRQKAIEELEKEYPEYNFLSLPFIHIAAGSMKGFPGCVYFKPKQLRKILLVFLKNIQQWGIENLIIIASHGDPFHNMAIEKACAYFNKRYKTNFISPMGAFFSYKELNINLKLGNDVEKMIEQYPKDFHAGWIETSMIMDISPELVSKDFHTVEDVLVTEKEMIRPKIYIQKTAGKGHLGYPKFSTPSLGKMLNESTKSFIATVVKKIITGECIEKYRYHFLFKVPFLSHFV